MVLVSLKSSKQAPRKSIRHRSLKRNEFALYRVFEGQFVRFERNIFTSFVLISVLLIAYKRVSEMRHLGSDLV